MSSPRERYALAAARQEQERLLASGRPPVPARITQALDSKGLYGPEVDHACGAEEPAVDEWEAGTRIPTGEQLRALAELTDVDVAFFFWPISEQELGPIFLCSSPTGGGERSTCEVIEWTNPRSLADVVPLHRQRPGQ